MPAHEPDDEGRTRPRKRRRGEQSAVALFKRASKAAGIGARSGQLYCPTCGAKKVKGDCPRCA